MNRKDGVIITSQELFLEYFNCDRVTTLVRAAIVDLGGVTFTKGAYYFILAIEDGVLWALAPLLFLCHLLVVLSCSDGLSFYWMEILLL